MMQKTVKLFTNICLSVALLASCKGSDEEAAFNSESVFSSVTSNVVQESQIFSPPNWGLTDGGRSFFEHAGNDVYNGLKVISSSAEPISNFTAQLAKDIENSTNFLSVDGTFASGQSLDMILPTAIFNSEAIALVSGDINFSQFKFEFQGKESSEKIEITPSFEDDVAEVTLDEFGTIIVTNICENDSTLAACQSASADINLVAPQLEFAIYHDKRPELRTFSWDNVGVATCSIDNGTTFGPCTSSTSHTLSVAEFNAKGTFIVRITDGNGSRDAQVDLASASTINPNVVFYECQLDIGSGDFSPFSSALSIPNTVVCLENNATITNPGTSISATVTASDIKVIGDHIERATVDNQMTSSGGPSTESGFVITDSEVINFVVANVIVETAGVDGVGIYLAHTGPTISNSIASNVEIIANDGKGISIKMKNNLNVFHSKVVKQAGNPNYSIKIDGPHLLVEDSEVTNLDNQSSIYIGSSEVAGPNLQMQRTTVSSGNSSNAISFGVDSTMPYIEAVISESILTTKTHGIGFANYATLAINDVLFRSTNSVSVSGDLLFVDSLSMLTINGSNLRYCRAQPSGGFARLGGTELTTPNSGTVDPAVNLNDCP